MTVDYFLANASMFCLIVANVYYPAKELVLRCGYSPKEIELFFNKYIKVHIVFNFFGLIAAVLHGVYAHENNIFLRLSFFFMVYLAISGMVLYTGNVQDTVRKKIIYFQKGVFVLCLFVITIGHFSFL